MPAGVANTAARCEPLHTKKTGHVQTRAADPAAQEITNEDARWIVTALAVGSGAPDEIRQARNPRHWRLWVETYERAELPSPTSGRVLGRKSFLHPVHRSYEQKSYLRDAGFEQSPGATERSE